jgi:hypothetical protein
MTLIVWLFLGFLLVLLFVLPEEKRSVKQYVDFFRPKEQLKKQSPFRQRSASPQNGGTPSSPGYQSRGEKITRYTLEHLFGKGFPSIRPDFLVNPETGRNLELDCYNEELKVAAEYNGEQHYKPTKVFHGAGPDKFITQVEHDEYKKVCCKRKGITLISIPYNVPYNEIPNFIIKKLEKKGFASYFVNKVDVQKAVNYARSSPS